MAIYWYQHMHTTERIEDITWILDVEPAIQLHLVWIRERFCCFHPWRNMEVSMENKEVNCPNCLIVSRKKKSIESELHSQFSSAHEVASLNKSFLSSLINLIKVMVTPTQPEVKRPTHRSDYFRTSSQRVSNNSYIPRFSRNAYREIYCVFPIEFSFFMNAISR